MEEQPISQPEMVTITISKRLADHIGYLLGVDVSRIEDEPYHYVVEDLEDAVARVEVFKEAVEQAVAK